MMIGLSVHLYPAFINARCDERLVARTDLSYYLTAVAERRLDSYHEVVLIGLAAYAYDVSAQVDDRRDDSLVLEELRHTVAYVSLGYPTEIEFCLRVCQFHPVALDRNVSVVDMFYGFGKSLFIREFRLALRSVEVPLLCDAADRYVKVAVRYVRVLHALLYKLYGLGAHFCPLALRGVDAADIRVLSGPAELRFEILAELK